MTKDTISETMVLKALLSETADNQILAEMLGFIADQVFIVAFHSNTLCASGRKVSHFNLEPKQL
jgi:hypothetical protein